MLLVVHISNSDCLLFDRVERIPSRRLQKKKDCTKTSASALLVKVTHQVQRLIDTYHVNCSNSLSSTYASTK